MSEAQTWATAPLADVVASNVRAEAARLGMNQIDLARALGVTQPTISRRWRGTRPWQINDLPKVAEVLGVEVSDLVTPTGREAGGPRGTRTLNPRIQGLFEALGTIWTAAA